MANIITNLHPNGDESTILYPNIKKENIPSKSISTDKLDDNVLSLIGSLKPSGTDTSTNILAYTSNKGIYVATDNGHWYYWNGSAYTDGGAYQATEIADNSIIPEKLKDSVFSPIYKKNEVVFTKDNINAINGIYTAPNKIINSSNHCIELEINNKNGYLSFDVSGGTFSNEIGFLIFDDNTSSSLKYTSL